MVSTLPKGHFLRLARPEELTEMLAIDDAASALFAQAGIVFCLPDEHPFVRAEAARWARSIESKLAYVAVGKDDRLLGFVTLNLVDGAPYMDELAVHPEVMRRGIGTALVRCALEWCGLRSLWLTTYSHVPWNAPFYERFGFVTVPERECGPELRTILEKQRAALPYPERRVAMVRRRKESMQPRAWPVLSVRMPPRSE